MKKHRVLYLLTGILIGALIFGGIPVLAAGITATVSTHSVTVNGKSVPVTAYNIDGANYFKIRDIASALDVAIQWDEATQTIDIQTDKGFQSNAPAPVVPAPTPAPQEGPATYTIADYYNASGKLSALGLALPLDEKHGEPQLIAEKGDIFIVGNDKYEVTVESLSVAFYTQPSMERVLEWWAEYFDSAIEGGQIVAVGTK